MDEALAEPSSPPLPPVRADRTVGKMFAVVGFGDALARIIAFGATAYVATRLGPGPYGVIAVASAIVLYFSHVADFSVEVLGARALARDPARVDTLVPPLVVARLLLAAACIVVLTIVGLVFLPQPKGIVLAVTSLGLLPVAASTRFVFLATSRPVAAALARVIGELLFFLTVLAIVRDTNDLASVPLSRLAGEGIAALLLVALLRRSGYVLPVRHDPGQVKPLFAGALPLVGHAILGLAIFNSDLIFLDVLKGERAVGVYAAAYTLVSFLLNVGVVYGNILLPALTREGVDAARQRTLFDTAMVQVLAAALPLAVGGYLLADGLIGLVFDPQFADGVPALRVLIWSIVVAWVRNVVQMGLIARDQQAFVLRTSVWSAVANVALNVALIPPFGLIGAAVATLATEIFRTVVAAWYAARLGLPFGVTRRLWRPVVAAATMAAALSVVPRVQVLLAIAGGAAIYVMVLLLTKGIRFDRGRPHLHL
jgi:O-antigen/teichoic acid export membrane protein